MPVRLANMEEPIPGYRLIERLGRGGFGEVWKAEAPGGLMKAIKFVYGELDAVGDDSKAAEQEWKALNRVKTIRHPYLLSLERFDIIDGQLLIVMELADRNMWDRFRECRSQNLPGIPRDELLQYLEEAAEALDLMNTQYQLQHLDIKPQNLFLVYNHVKVADFGLAKDLEGMRATVTGGVTPVYAAPETFEGWVSRFSDQYSLAIVYQEVLTGVRPFNGTNTRQLLMQHISGVPDLSSLPEAERPIVARALSKKPDDRYPYCTDFIQALRNAGNSTAHSASTPVNGPGAVPTVSSGGSVIQTQPMAKTPARSDSAPPSTPAMPPLRAPHTPGGGMPSLVTQSQLIHSHGLTSDADNVKLTMHRNSVIQTGRMASFGLAGPEQVGSGTLIPALIVGLGQTGLVVMQQFRQAVHERFGPTVTLPHIQYLHIDTDPDTLHEATAAPPPIALGPKEVVLARLNRPGHYLKREGLPPIDGWLSNQLLYRMPRNPSTIGTRAFGRLALCDNYRSVIVRIRQILEPFLQPDSLAEAEKQTGLGLRSNRPRIYLLTSLSGGTGSGMFIDLAYILKHELRSMGYTKPEVIGLCFVPGIDRNTAKTQSVANSYAALQELKYFSAPNTIYDTRFDNRESPVVDPEPPFSRCAFLTLPKSHESKPLRQLASQAAGALFQELLTPIGRVVDEARHAYWNTMPTTGLRAQTFGLFRLSWPRQRLLETAVRRFAQGTLVRWMAKDNIELRPAIETWLQGEWDRRQLDLESIVNRMQYTPDETSQQNADALFQSVAEPLSNVQATKLDTYTACQLLDTIFKVLGKPESEKDQPVSQVGEVLTHHAQAIVQEGEVKLAEMAVYFIEEPMYRLAGAEEAIQQLIAKLKLTLETLEPLAIDLGNDVQDIYSRLFPLIGALDGQQQNASKNRPNPSQDVVDLIRSYVQNRYRHLTVQTAIGVYRSLLGNAPEYLREVNFCRLRLSEMARNLANMSRMSLLESARGHGQYILPPNCRTLDEAAELFLQTLTCDELREYDKTVQSQIRRQFRALVNICLETNDHSPALKAILEEQAMSFLGKRLPTSNPAQMFFQYRDQLQVAQREVLHAYDESAPEMLGNRSRSLSLVCILGVPPNEHGDQFRALARDVLTDEDVVMASCQDEIVFYREQRHIAIADLPQVGPIAREAYQHALLPEQLSPHTRIDIPWKVGE